MPCPLPDLRGINMSCQKYDFFYQGRDSLCFQVFPRQFYCMRGPSLVELKGRDNSGADIMTHNKYIQFLMHSSYIPGNMYRYRCIHTYMDIQYC